MLPRESTPIYTIVYFLIKVYYTIACRLRVEGLEHFPETGACMVVCNHTKGNDYFPLAISVRRQIWYMAKIEAYQIHPAVGWLLRKGGSVPVDRGKGDRDALRAALEIIKSGRVLGMFPEGHRSPDGTLQKGHTGATRIGLESKVLVVPVGVIGAERAWRNFPRFWSRPELIIRFGTPYTLEGRDGSDRSAVVAGTRRIMLSIAELLPEEMRGDWSASALAAESPARAARRERLAAQTAAADAEA